jgi:endonuclease NucS-like protein
LGWIVFAQGGNHGTRLDRSNRQLIEELPMSLYDQPVRVLLATMIDEFKSSNRQQFDNTNAIDWFAERYPRIKESTIRAHLRRFSVNDPSRHHYHPRPGEDLLIKLSPTNYRMFDPDRDPPGTSPPILPDMDDEESADGVQKLDSEFAYERDLQHYLAKNLHAIEPGLQLWKDDDGSIDGIEFDVGGRRIDILAVDKNNDLVVIELKVSKGYDRVVGQIARYMAWIEQHHADEGQSVRGVIIAREIGEDLRLATSKISDVELFEYTLSIELERIGS